jgi:ADP-ribosylarginine hydrolase
MSAEEHKAMGNSAFKSGKLTSAIVEYTKCLELEPTNHIVLSNRALTYYKLGELENALKDAQMSISINQEYPKSFYHAGVILTDLKMYNEALANFKMVDKLSPSEDNDSRMLHVQNYIDENAMNIISSPMEERYIASMVLASVGDAMGYKNGDWEFNYKGTSIHRVLKNEFGGISDLDCSPPYWIVSDDTVMHLATGEALIDTSCSTVEEIMTKMAKEYIICWDDMSGRGPGPTCGSGIGQLVRGRWDSVRYDKAGGGCGGSMRSMAIGLRYPGTKNREMLVAISLESGRLTHNHPTGFLGAVCAAAFTAFAIEYIPPKKWGYLLMTEILPMAKKYCKDVGRDWKEIERDWIAFESQFNNYLKERGISDGESDPVFPQVYGVQERDDFYKKWSYRGWGGASGDDSCIIAYDALLGSNDNWEEFCLRGVLHGGDNDSTGCIGCAWFGALYGFKNVFYKNYRRLEKRLRISNMAREILRVSGNQ